MEAWQKYVTNAVMALASIFNPGLFAGLMTVVEDHEDAVTTLEALRVDNGLETVNWIPAETLVTLGRVDLRRVAGTGSAGADVSPEFPLCRSAGSAGAAAGEEGAGGTGSAGSSTHPPPPLPCHENLARIFLLCDSTGRLKYDKDDPTNFVGAGSRKGHALHDSLALRAARGRQGAREREGL